MYLITMITRADGRYGLHVEWHRRSENTGVVAGPYLWATGGVANASPLRPYY